MKWVSTTLLAVMLSVSCATGKEKKVRLLPNTSTWVLVAAGVGLMCNSACCTV